MSVRADRRRALRAIAEILLLEKTSPSELELAARDLHRLLEPIGGGRYDTSDTALPAGKALSPSAAGACTRDAARTALFLRGVRDAIADVRTSRAGRRLEVVYAGTGPFAPLALPLMTLLDPRDVRFTLVDIHEESVASVGALIGHFGLEPHVGGVVRADAARYGHDRPIDVAVAEVMQRALAVEPQVAVARNLASQMARGGRMVPEQTTVDLVYAPLEYAQGIAPDPLSRRIDVATVADLRSAVVAEPDEKGRLAPRIVAIPLVPDGHYPLYATSIQTFGRHVLGQFASGLTYPEVVWDLARCRAGEQIRFWYGMGERPGIGWERVGTHCG